MRRCRPHPFDDFVDQLTERETKMAEKMEVEWVEIDSAEDVENALVGDDLILWDGCNFAIDYVETEVEFGTSFFANGTEATHYLRGLKPPSEKS